MHEPCPEPHLIEAFAAGRVAPQSRAAIEAHLDRCPTCAATVAACARLFGSVPPTGGLATPFALTVGISTPGGRGPHGSMPHADAVGLVSDGVRAGRYVLGQRLGEGGMGVVFSAHDPELARPVAVKLLHPGLVAAGDPSRTRLMREAQAMARLAHPHVVAVYDVGTMGDQLFIAMELVEGTTLRGWLASRPRPEEVLRVLLEAGRGLAAAHDAGLVHRDFKPDNVLVGRDGRARVTDFGVARDTAFGSVDVAASPAASGLALAPAPTERGALIGTPAYMAPEQLLGRSADARSDQFAFGVTVHEAIFGVRPFAGTTFGELMANVVAGRIVEPPRKTPSWLRAWLSRTLAASPEARFADMHAVLRELGRDHGRARRYVLGATGVVAVAATIVGAMHLATRNTATGAAPTCDARAIEGVWNETRKGEVAAALDGDAWSARIVGRQLDEYASSWTEARTATCATDVVPAVREARLACLDRALVRLDTAVTILRGPRDDASPTQIVFALPALRGCLDEQTDQVDPTPDDAKLATKVEAVRRDLGEARVTLAGGDVDAAKRIVRKAESAANASGYAPVIVEAKLEVARWERVSSGDGLSAAVTFEMAANQARAAGHDRVVREATIDMVEAVGVGQSDPPKAATYQKLAEAEVTRAPWDTGSAARLARHVAAVAMVAGDVPAAVTSARRAVDLYRALRHAPHPHTVEALLVLADALRQSGDAPGATAAAADAVQMARTIFEDRGDLLADAYRALADAERDAGDPTGEAVAHAEAAKRTEDAGSGDRLRMIAALRSLGLARAATGDPKGGIASFDEAITIARSARIWKRRPQVELLRLRGDAQLGLGDHAAALASYAEALTEAETVAGPDHIEAGSVHLARCHALLAAKDTTNAALDCDEAVGFFEAANVWGTAQAHELAWTDALVTQAQVALARGDRGRAREVIDRFLVGRSVRVRPSHPVTADILLRAADVLASLGDKEKMRDVLDRARAARTIRFGADDPRTRAVVDRIAAD